MDWGTDLASVTNRVGMLRFAHPTATLGVPLGANSAYQVPDSKPG